MKESHDGETLHKDWKDLHQPGCHVFGQNVEKIIIGLLLCGHADHGTGMGPFSEALQGVNMEEWRKRSFGRSHVFSDDQELSIFLSRA